MTDPPYNVSYEGKTADGLTIANDSWADEGAFEDFLAAALGNAASAMRPGAAFYVWLASTHTPAFASAVRRAGLGWKQTIVWNKNSLVLGRQDYQWKHEPCLYGWKPGAGHYFCDCRSKTTVWDFAKPSRSADHPTMKPVGLIGECVANSSRAGDAVLDPFLGSGTTLLACERLGRRCLGMELDPRYCDVVIARWEEMTGRRAERVGGTGD